MNSALNKNIFVACLLQGWILRAALKYASILDTFKRIFGGLWRFGDDTVGRRCFGAETFWRQDILSSRYLGPNDILEQSRFDTSVVSLSFNSVNTLIIFKLVHSSS